MTNQELIENMYEICDRLSKDHEHDDDQVDRLNYLICIAEERLNPK